MADVVFSVGADTSEADKAIAQLADKAVSQLGSIKDTLKTAFTFDALSSAGDFLTSFSEGGEEAVNSMRKLQGQLGLFGDDLKSVRAQADDLFLAGVGENVSEAIAAIGSAKQQLGGVLDDQGLGDFTKTAAGVANVFDTEVSEVISKSRTLIQNFGLDGKEAGDLVALGMQKAANADGDFLDTLSEYSPLMKKAGLSAQEFTGILTKGVQEGARNTDILADSIKEAGIRIQAGDVSNALKDISTPITASIQEIVKAGEQGQISTAEVIQRATSEIGKAFDAGKISDQMRSQLQIAIAGTPAEEIGADLYQRIFSAPVDASAITAEAAKAGEQIGAALGPKTVFESLSRNFDLIKTKVSEFAAPVISGLGGVLSTVSSIGPAISLIIPLLPTLAGGFTAVWAAVTGPVGIVVAAIAAVVAGLVLLYDNFKPFTDFVDSLVAGIGQVIDTVMPALSAFGDVLLSIGELVLEWIIAPFEFAWTVITAITDAIFGASDTSVDFSAIIKVLGGVIDKLVSAFGAMKKGIDFAKATLEGLKAGVSAFIESTIGAFGKLLSLDFGGFFEGIAGGVERANDQIASVASNALRQQSLDKEAERVLSETSKTINEIVKQAVDGRRTAQEAIDSIQKIVTSSGSQREKLIDEDVLADALKQLEELKVKAAETVKKEPVKIPTKVTPPKPAEIVSFRDEVQKLLDEQTALQAKIAIEAEGDPIKKLELEFAERQRLLDLEVANERAALEKKAADAIAAKKKLSTQENATLEAAKRELNKKERLLDEQLQNERLKAIADLARERAVAEIDARNAALSTASSDELALLKDKQGVLTDATIAAIQERGRLSLREQRVQQDAETEQLLQSLVSRRLLEAQAAGVDAADLVALEQQLREGFRSHERVVALLARQGVERKKLIDDQQAAEVQSLRETDAAWIASMALRTRTVEAFGEAFDTEILGSLQEERDELLSQQDELWADFLDGRIQSYRDYAAELGDINQQIADKDAEIQAETIDGWAAAAIAIGATFASIRDTYDQKFSETQSKLFGAFESAVAFQDDTTTEGIAATTKALAEMETLATDAYANTAAAYGAGLGAMLDDNKVTLREFLSVSLKALSALVPVFIVEIFGKELAKLGVLGLVSAAAGAAILQGLLASAANAINSFERGGFPEGRNVLVQVNERGPEYIADHLSTERNRDAFEWLHANKGADLSLFFNAAQATVAGPSQREMAAMHMMGKFHASQRQATAELSALRHDVRTLAATVNTMAANPQPIVVINETGVVAASTVSVDPDKMVKVQTRATIDKLGR